MLCAVFRARRGKPHIIDVILFFQSFFVFALTEHENKKKGKYHAAAGGHLLRSESKAEHISASYSAS